MNLPAPPTAGGPPIFLGGQKRRGIALAGRARRRVAAARRSVRRGADLADRREALLSALDAHGRDPEAFTIVGQVICGESPADRRRALEQARAMVEAGATHVILGMAPRLGPDGLRTIAREVAEPLLEASGWEGRAA